MIQTPVAEDTSPPDLQQFLQTRWARYNRFAYSLTANAADAADALQDALIAVYPHWDQIADGNPDAYIRKSIVNAYLMICRRGRRTVTVDHIDDWSRPDSDQTEQLAGTALARWLCDRLPPKQRTAVVMRYLEDRSYAEIADFCGGTEATARSLTRHAISTLRDLLAKGN